MATMGDIVLIYCEEEPAFFARIEDISPDRKSDWYQVKLLVLQVPLKEALWILREEYINGEDFTMNGRRIRMNEVSGAQVPKSESLPSDTDSRKNDAPVSAKVISIFDRKRD
ncbi:MAG: hypothetical protein BA872_07520 [Desulfobacterales bacterium C00003060]|nr:MAG: hypothetical protein BA861_03690 [Desulfobacterales bacterium S3730MH5]OEU80956.1 MAG: hypothetical protein BA872_07520 [Desulfobacterales bacterium C00003060]OEU81031.1 MAG: hypothetical protein BA865_03205 [Desulfobacterales bacterium S5133MH4]